MFHAVWFNGFQGREQWAAMLTPGPISESMDLTIKFPPYKMFDPLSLEKVVHAPGTESEDPDNGGQEFLPDPKNGIIFWRVSHPRPGTVYKVRWLW